VLLNTQRKESPYKILVSLSPRCHPGVVLLLFSQSYEGSGGGTQPLNTNYQLPVTPYPLDYPSLPARHGWSTPQNDSTTTRFDSFWDSFQLVNGPLFSFKIPLLNPQNR
jgi:hypothetical protein